MQELQSQRSRWVSNSRVPMKGDISQALTFRRIQGSPFTMSVESIKVADGEADMRLDRWFRVHFPEVGYTYLQKLLRSGQIRVDSKRAQANDRLSAGAEIRVPAIIRQPKKVSPTGR